MGRLRRLDLLPELRAQEVERRHGRRIVDERRGGKPWRPAPGAVIVARDARLRVEHLPERSHTARGVPPVTSLPPMLPFAELERLAILRTERE